jgi:hypothetical protein
MLTKAQVGEIYQAVTNLLLAERNAMCGTMQSERALEAARAEYMRVVSPRIVWELISTYWRLL